MIHSPGLKRILMSLARALTEIILELMVGTYQTLDRVKTGALVSGIKKFIVPDPSAHTIEPSASSTLLG
jgi:hypothetical protein